VSACGDCGGEDESEEWKVNYQVWLRPRLGAVPWQQRHEQVLSGSKRYILRMMDRIVINFYWYASKEKKNSYLLEYEMVHPG
jgi:hypothetical protein